MVEANQQLCDGMVSVEDAEPGVGAVPPIETPPHLSVRHWQPEKDYPMVSEWWTGHGWSVVPRAILPGCGLVVERGGEPQAAAWLYMENSGVGVAMMEWAVTRPGLSPWRAAVAVKTLVQAVREVAQELDYGVVLTTARQDSLVKLYERNGFIVTDRGMTHLIMLTKEGV